MQPSQKSAQNQIKNASSEAFLNGNMLIRFEALQHVLVPRSEHFSAAEKQRSKNLINKLLSQQTAGSKKKLALFITLIDIVSIFCHARTFKKLPSNSQRAILEVFFDSPISLLRKGFWGLNTLARLGVYGQKELHEDIGYRLRAIPATSLTVSRTIEK